MQGQGVRSAPLGCILELRRPPLAKRSCAPAGAAPLPQVGAGAAYLLGLYDDQPEAAAMGGSSVWDVVPGGPVRSAKTFGATVACLHWPWRVVGAERLLPFEGVHVVAPGVKRQAGLRTRVLLGHTRSRLGARSTQRRTQPCRHRRRRGARGHCRGRGGGRPRRAPPYRRDARRWHGGSSRGHAGGAGRHGGWAAAADDSPGRHQLHLPADS